MKDESPEGKSYNWLIVLSLVSALIVVIAARALASWVGA